MSARPNLNLGAPIEMRRASGRWEVGEIVTRRGVESRLVIGVRFPDGQVESMVCEADPERGHVDNAHGLAAAIIAGAPVHMPVGEQLQILASAVLGAPAGAR